MSLMRIAATLPKDAIIARRAVASQTPSALNRILSRYYSSPAAESSLSWPEFFSLRRRVVRYKRWGGVPFVLASWAAEGFLLSLPIFDPTRSILSMDPMVVVGLATIVASIGSYVLGSALVGKLWAIWRPGAANALNLKQRDFYHRISKYRANVPPNPTQMNFSFDYYGEKIRSVADYRTWLRRQKRLLSERQFPV